MNQSLSELAAGLSKGWLHSADLVADALDQIAGAEGQNGTVMLATYADQARAQAALTDAARARGLPLPKFAGIPLTIKDVFDVAGETTRAGSRVLDIQPPASADATIVRRLRRAGFVVIGKTNMTEFAYSGLGINAHFGTPRNPHDRVVSRIPGGSSSGSVASGIVPASIGTDTGGSCRIPAAFCGIVGFKPTSGRVPTQGTIPLSRSLDCIGPLANSVSCCAQLDSVLSGGVGADVAPFPANGLRLCVLGGYASDHIDAEVGKAYEAALSRLSVAGVRLFPLTIAELADLPGINAKGGIVGAEAYAWHAPFIDARADHYDPWILERFSAGRSQSARDYIAVIEARSAMQASVAERLANFDAAILPTVQIIAPSLASLADNADSVAANLLCLRNTAIANFLDLPAITIPCQKPGQPAVGAMLFGRKGDDQRLLSVARGLETIITGQ